MFELVYYGEGFTFEDVMTMPVNLRAFYYMKLADILEKKKQAMEAANKGRGRNLLS